MQHGDMFNDVTNCLETLRGTRFVFVPNPGNAGDSFIAHATYQFEGLRNTAERTEPTFPCEIVRGLYPGKIRPKSEVKRTSILHAVMSAISQQLTMNHRIWIGPSL
jgi:hypothetical protein